MQILYYGWHFSAWLVTFLSICYFLILHLVTILIRCYFTEVSHRQQLVCIWVELIHLAAFLANYATLHWLYSQFSQQYRYLTGRVAFTPIKFRFGYGYPRFRFELCLTVLRVISSRMRVCMARPQLFDSDVYFTLATSNSRIDKYSQFSLTEKS